MYTSSSSRPSKPSRSSSSNNESSSVIIPSSVNDSPSPVGAQLWPPPPLPPSGFIVSTMISSSIGESVIVGSSGSVVVTSSVSVIVGSSVDGVSSSLLGPEGGHVDGFCVGSTVGPIVSVTVTVTAPSS